MTPFRFFPVSVVVSTSEGRAEARITDAMAIVELNEILGTSRYQVQRLDPSQFVAVATPRLHEPIAKPRKPRKKR